MDSGDGGTRARIVAATVELLRRQGYHATSVKQIAENAHAPMGSLYHHFPGGKEEIAAAALRGSGAAYGELVTLILETRPQVGDAVRHAFAEAAAVLESSGWLNLCPVGTVAAEVADTVPALRAVCNEIIEDWSAAATSYFAARGLSEGDARDLGLTLIGALEGAFTLCRTQRRPDALLAAGAMVAARAAALVTSPRQPGPGR